MCFRSSLVYIAIFQALLLCNTVEALVTLNYKAFIVQKGDRLGDVINNTGFDMYSVGTVRITITDEPISQFSTLRAEKLSESELHRRIDDGISPSSSSAEGLSQSVLPAVLLTTALFARWISTITTGNTASAPASIESHDFTDLGHAQETNPIPKFSDLDSLNGLFGFFHHAPIGSVWTQHEEELELMGCWELIRKTIQVISSSGHRTVSRQYLPTTKKNRESQEITFRPGWNPAWGLITQNQASLADLSIADGYQFYVPQEKDSKEKRLPIIGLPSLYHISITSIPPLPVSGWLPEFLPSYSNRKSLYSIVQDTNRPENLSLHTEFSTQHATDISIETSVFATTREDCIFSIYSSIETPWIALNIQSGEYRLVLIRQKNTSEESEQDGRIRKKLEEALDESKV